MNERDDAVLIELTVDGSDVINTRFCFPKAMPFDEAKAAIIRARDELTRQVDEYFKCPMSDRRENRSEK